jgi:hypothetical protein
VKIGEGAEVLEVKRNGVAGRKVYTSVADWENSFGADTINERSVEEKAAAATAAAGGAPAHRPVRSRPAPLPPQNADIAFMQQLYKDYNRKSNSKLKPSKVERMVCMVDQLVEAKRLEALTPTPFNDTTVKQLKKFVTNWESWITYPSYANQKSRMITWQFGRTFYVRDSTTSTLNPISLGKTVPTDQYMQGEVYNIMSHLWTAPQQEWICYNGKVGSTFAEVGIPVGPDGKPELWMAGGKYGAITRYAPTA